MTLPPADPSPVPSTDAPPGTRPVARRVSHIDDSRLAGLTEVLLDCVDGGASVGFMSPLSSERALAFWRRIAAEVARGERALMIVEDELGVVGTVQLVLAQPDNQPHRGDLSKMLVHRRGRRQGVGAMLMAVAEEVARECGKSLLVLDTASPEAERLYERSGWVRCGTVPDFALLPGGGFCDTTIFYRRLPSAALP